jgi:hypothetical protein
MNIFVRFNTLLKKKLKTRTLQTKAPLLGKQYYKGTNASKQGTKTKKHKIVKAVKSFRRYSDFIVHPD